MTNSPSLPPYLAAALCSPPPHGGWGYGAAGFAAAALLGRAIASRPYDYGHYGPPAYAYASGPGYPDGDEAYCESRFRSYDPASGTYVGYDGRRHPCP